MRKTARLSLRLQQQIISSATPTGHEHLEDELQSILGKTYLTLIETKNWQLPIVLKVRKRFPSSCLEI